MTDSEFKELGGKIFAEIDKAKSILLHFHPNPDPDSVGSALAMGEVLKGLGKQVTVITGDSPPPDFLPYLPGHEAVLAKNFLELDLSQYDLFIIQDISKRDRVSSLGPVEFPSTLRTVIIDHHNGPDDFAQVILVDTAAPATAEILFYLFAQWGIKLNHDAAANLLVGLSTDTGGFRYPRTSTRTFAAAAALAALAPDFVDYLFAIDNNRAPEALRFQALALGAIELAFGGKVAVVALSANTLAAESIRPEHYEGISIANILRSVKGWDVGVSLIEEVSGVVRVSLRTRDATRYDLSEAARALGGGGHRAAAGANLKMPLPEARAAVLKALEQTFFTSSTTSVEKGFGLIGLLLTFAVVTLMLWLSLDLLRPIPALDLPADQNLPIDTQSTTASTTLLDQVEALKENIEARTAPLDLLE